MEDAPAFADLRLTLNLQHERTAGPQRAVCVLQNLPSPVAREDVELSVDHRHQIESGARVPISHICVLVGAPEPLGSRMLGGMSNGRRREVSSDARAALVGQAAGVEPWTACFGTLPSVADEPAIESSAASALEPWP